MVSRLALAFVSLAAVALLSCGNDPKPSVDANSSCASPGTTELLQACTANENCNSCVCKNFGHTMVCSKTCSGASDCPSMSTCTNGFCQPVAALTD